MSGSPLIAISDCLLDSFVAQTSFTEWAPDIVQTPTGPLRAWRDRSFPRSGGFDSDFASTRLHQVQAGPLVVEARFHDRKIEAAIMVPVDWPRYVFARGISRDQLVTEIIEDTGDPKRLIVNAARWEPDGDDYVIRIRPAEMTCYAPFLWHTRWLDEPRA